MSKKYYSLIQSFLLGAFLFVLSPIPLQANEVKHIGITAIVEHPALEACQKGILDYLAENGFVEGENLKLHFESAQGNTAIAVQIAKKFAGDELDVIIPISTPSAQAIAANIKNTPIIFSAVTDPVKAGLIESLDQPGQYITGVSDASPIDKHLELIKDLAPFVKRIGVITNPGEVNSVVILEDLRKFSPQFDFTLVETIAPRSSDVLMAAQSLVGKVDAIYVPSDNTIVSALEAIIQVGIKAKIPVFSGDTDSVTRGTIAAIGFDYYDVGRQTGKLVLRVLQGESPHNIAIETVDNINFFLNLKAAEEMGFIVPDDQILKAEKVIR